MPIGDSTPGDDDDENGNGDENGGNGEDLDEIERRIDDILDNVERTADELERAGGLPDQRIEEIKDSLTTFEERQHAVEDRLERIEDAIGEIEEVFQNIQFGMGGTPGETEEVGGDLWEVGDMRESATSIGDYKRRRRIAAQNEDYVSPMLDRSWDDIERDDEKIRVYFSLYEDGYACLEEISKLKLPDDEWDNFVLEMVKHYGISREELADDTLAVDFSEGIILPLVDVIDPKATFFGISSVDGELRINEAQTPIPMLQAWGDHYYMSGDGTIPNRPWDELGVDEPEDWGAVRGQSFREFNVNMRIMIDEGEKYDMPRWLDELLTGQAGSGDGD